MIRELYRKIVPRKVRVLFEWIRKKEIRDRIERKKRYGRKNPSQTFYVIRTEENNWGLLTTVTCVLEHIEYALEKGYIPVVDLKNYRMEMMQDKEHFGLENAWEYYFEQPVSGIELTEVYKSKNVILSWKGSLPRADRPNWSYELPAEAVCKYHSLVENYLRPSKEICVQIVKNAEKLFPKEGKVLGVSVRRGYEHIKRKGDKIVTGHPEQAGLEEYINDINYLMEKWECDYLFISVDDRETSDFFVTYYGEKCIRFQRALRHYFTDGKVEKRAEIGLCEYKYDSSIVNGIANVEETTKEYLTEVYLLAKCDCLLASISSSSQMASIIKGGKYEHVKIYDKGLITLEEKK